MTEKMTNHLLERIKVTKNKNSATPIHIGHTRIVDSTKLKEQEENS